MWHCDYRLSQLGHRQVVPEIDLDVTLDRLRGLFNALEYLTIDFCRATNDDDTAQFGL